MIFFFYISIAVATSYSIASYIKSFKTIAIYNIITISTWF